MKTKYHGVLTETGPIYTFEDGIPGFPDETTFVVLPLDGDSPFLVLQSATEPELAFILVNPFDFFSGYEVKLPDSLIQKLAIEEQKDVLIYSILTIAEPFEKTTANLQAPVVLNVAKQTGKQLILSDSPYETKHQLFAQKVTSREGK